ncbi:MAG: S1 RNA-binding domain-containing protein [Clostridia bacterium]|nr:S1 RNA-binding domain-containing protein [Clostridia bacterium]
MQVKRGAVVDGVVTGIKTFGAFVKLPTGETGMVHISEVASSYVSDIGDFLAEGQEVRVKVLGENEKGKISLSIKQAQSGDAAPEKKSRPVKKDAPRRGGRPPVWQGVRQQADPADMSFEDMLAAFKKTSDEKMSDLRRGGGETRSRRGNGNKS